MTCHGVAGISNGGGTIGGAGGGAAGTPPNAGAAEGVEPEPSWPSSLLGPAGSLLSLLGPVGRLLFRSWGIGAFTVTTTPFFAPADPIFTIALNAGARTAGAAVSLANAVRSSAEEWPSGNVTGPAESSSEAALHLLSPLSVERVLRRHTRVFEGSTSPEEITDLEVKIEGQSLLEARVA